MSAARKKTRSVPTAKVRPTKTLRAAKSKSKSQSRSQSRSKSKSATATATATALGRGATEVLRRGQAWSAVLPRGQILRIKDTSGSACVSALFYNARNPSERYNVADTLKAQYTAFLTAGRVLYSDMGRVLVSIIADTCGWHDTLSGCGNAATQTARFGAGDYQALRNDFHRNARDNFIVELSKVGLDKRDIVANVNFFARVVVDDLGAMSWSPDNSHAGAFVDLRAEMDTLVVLSNTPHPLAPLAGYPAADVEAELSIRKAGARERPGPRDPCRLSRLENERGFALTETYVATTSSDREGESLRSGPRLP